MQTKTFISTEFTLKLVFRGSRKSKLRNSIFFLQNVGENGCHVIWKLCNYIWRLSKWSERISVLRYLLRFTRKAQLQNVDTTTQNYKIQVCKHICIVKHPKNKKLGTREQILNIRLIIETACKYFTIWDIVDYQEHV